MRRWKAGALVAGLLALGAVAGAGVREAHRNAPVALAAENWSVTAGGIAPGGFESNNFFPAILSIHVGDTVNWTIAGFHTVTFDAGQPPLPALIPQPDGTLLGGPGFFPFPPGPMPPTGPYDGSTQVSSGTPQSPDDPPFSLTFTKAGRYGYYCIIHPGMEAVVTVVEASAPLLRTPDDIRQQAAGWFQEDIDKIKGAVARYRNATATLPDGDMVVTASAGLYEADGGTAFLMLPSRITVPRGSAVAWTQPDPTEIHTVTFLSGGPPVDFVTVTPNPMGPPRITVAANVAGPSGGTTYTGTGYVNSGVLPPGGSFVLVFDAPPGEYEYLCLIHPEMKGTVVVTE